MVTGKGGVGKSTVAAALALRLGPRGLRTLVCEVNTTERVTTLLGHPEVGPEIDAARGQPLGGGRRAGRGDARVRAR